MEIDKLNTEIKTYNKDLNFIWFRACSIVIPKFWVKGIVSGIEPYGIFIKIDEDYSGLIHISEISNRFVRNISDYVEQNEIINVKILDIDVSTNHMNLSIKDIPYRIQNRRKRRKIIETKLGFKTLDYKLPFWIKENIENYKKNS